MRRWRRCSRPGLGTRAVGRAVGPFTPPKSVDAFRVVQKLKGDATTDFGAPGIAPKADSRALAGKELARQQKLLEASWAALERAAMQSMGGKPAAGETKELRKQFLETVTARTGGEEPTPGPRKKKPFWTPRYAGRRSAWHALDHAWEIEDRGR